MILRQATSQAIRFGPFLDDTDGVTPETALTITQADMQISKDGGAFAQKNAVGNATHDTDGWYATTLDTTDTATVGEFLMQVNVSGALPVWVRYWVVEEGIYDGLYGAAAAGFNASGQVAGIQGTLNTLDDLDTAQDAQHTQTQVDISAVQSDTDNIQTRIPAALVGGRMDSSVGAMDANTLTASALATDAVTEIQSGLATSANQTTILARLGAITGSGVNTILGFFQALMRDDASAPTDIAGTYDPSTDSLEAQRDNVGTNGAALSLAKTTNITGFNDLSAAQVNAEVDSAIETYHLDHLLAADYDPASKPGVATALLNEIVENDAGVSRFTANALEQAPSGGATAADIADAVWDEAIADHLTAGTTGEALNNAGSGASASTIADAVWDETLADHLTAGSTGAKLNASSGTTFPAGAIEFTYTVTDSVSGNPLEGVEVWVATDAAGTNVVWKGDTDAFGVAMDVLGNKPMLDAGTYYFWRQLAGYSFTNPDSETVS